jgi:hypothetical protein
MVSSIWNNRMDFFFFQLAIIFLPGLIWERIVAKYGLKRRPTSFETGLRTFTFGLTSYVVTFGIFSALRLGFLIPEVKSNGPFIVDKQYLSQFVVAIAVGIAGSVFWLYSIRRRWAGRFLRWIGATKRYGEEDIWDFAFNSSAAWSEYVYVRDYANQKVFSGWVVGFSENEETRELLLRDVDVYNLEGKQLYTSPLMYLGRSPDSVDIEFPVARGVQDAAKQSAQPPSTAPIPGLENQ